MDLAFLVAAILMGADGEKKPVFTTVDLGRGETVQVRFPDGGQVTGKWGIQDAYLVCPVRV